MFKKIILSVFLIFTTAACTITNSKSGIIFSDRAISADNLENKTFFKAGERVYFAVLTKKGFEDDIIEYQLIKHGGKIDIGGYKIVYAKRARVTNENYYLDYIAPTEAGEYTIQVFELRNLQQPIANGGFKICE